MFVSPAGDGEQVTNENRRFAS
ncbi:hypothetical protein JMJ77_0006413, partial [Colletotrichum scovillei]